MKRYKSFLTIFIFIIFLSLFLNVKAIDNKVLEITVNGITNGYYEDDFDNLSFDIEFDKSTENNPVTLKLFRNLEANFIINSGNNIIMDLNGYSIIGQSSSYVIKVNQNGKLSVINNEGESKIQNKYNSDSNIIYELIYNDGQYSSDGIDYNIVSVSNINKNAMIINNNQMNITNSKILNNLDYVAILNHKDMVLDDAIITGNKTGIDNYGSIGLVDNTIINDNDNNCVLNDNSLLNFSNDFIGSVKYLSNVTGCLTKNYDKYMKGTLENEESSYNGYIYNGELYFYDTPFNVTFYDNLESNDYVEATIEFGSNTFDKDISFENQGYILQGYSTSKTGNIFIVDDNNKPFISVDGYTDSNGSWIKTSDTILYAIWSEIGYTIVIHYDDEMINKSVETGDVSISDLSISKPGYDLLGLYDAMNNKICDENFNFLPNTEYTTADGSFKYSGSISLFAKYQPKEYKIEVFDGTDTFDYFIDYGTNEIKNFTPLNKTGYIFKGFIDENNSLIFDSLGNLISDITSISSADGNWILNDNLTLYPYYEAKNYKLSVNDSDLEFYVKMGDTSIGEFVKPIKTYYTFEGFSYNGVLLIDSNGNFVGENSIYINDKKWIYDGDLSLDIKFVKTPIHIVIDFKNGDSKEYDKFSGDILSNLESIPLKDGFVFAGIYDQNSEQYFDEEGNFVKNEIITDIELYALWGIKYNDLLYTISLNENNINGSGNYYLTDDVNVLNGYVIKEGWNVNIFLNGHSISTSSNSIFDISENAYLSIYNLTTTRGYLKEGKGKLINGKRYGGAIYSKGNLTLSYVDVINNNSDDGIIYSSGTLDFDNVCLENNSSSASIVYITGSENNKFYKVSIDNNEALLGINNTGNLSINDIAFNENEIKGPLILNSGDLSIEQIMFNDNVSTVNMNGALIENSSTLNINKFISKGNIYENAKGLIYNDGNSTIQTIDFNDSYAKTIVFNSNSLMKLEDARIEFNNHEEIIGIKNDEDAQLILDDVTIKTNSGKGLYNLGEISLVDKIIIDEESYVKENSINIASLSDESRIKINSSSENNMIFICEIPQSLASRIDSIFSPYNDDYRLYILEDSLYLLNVSLEKIFNISYNSTLDGYEISGFTQDYLLSNSQITIEIPNTYNDAFHGEKNIVKISENAFKDTNIVGAVRLPNNLKVLGDNSFLNTNVDTVYLPSINGNDSFINDTVFNSKVIIIANSISDYSFLKGKIESKFLTCIMNVTLDSNGGDTEDYNIKKLYNLDYHYDMKSNDSWYLNDDYELPKASLNKYQFIGYNTEASGGGNTISKIIKNRYYAIYDRIMISLDVSIVGNNYITVNDDLTSSKWSDLVKVEIEYLDGLNKIETSDYSIRGDIKAGLCKFEFSLKSNENIKGYLDLQIIDPSITSIGIKQNPNKLEYNAFDKFDSEGLILNIYRGEEVTEATNFSYEYKNGDSIKNQGEGKDIITIIFGDKKIDIEVIVNKINFELPSDLFVDKEIIYDGNIHYLEIETLPDGLIIKEYKNNNLKTVGSKEAIVLLEPVDKFNYLDIPSLKATITILPKKLELDWIADNEFEYDKKPKTIRVEAKNLVDGDTCNISIKLSEGSDNINAGTFTFFAYEISNPNYKLPENVISDEFEIKKARAVASWSNLYTIYNGNVQKPSIEISGLYPTDTCEAVYDGYKDAGVYRVKILSLTNNNYYVLLTENEFEIEKASYSDLELFYSNLTATYDGKEHEALINGNIPDDISIVYSNNRLTNVGEITAKASFIVDENNYYPFADVTCTIKIVKRFVEKPQASSKTYKYTGNELTYNINTSDYYTVENHIQIDAGEYKVVVKLTSPENACWIGDTIEQLEYDFIILKAKYDLDITFESNSFEYDGNPHSLKIEGNLPDGVSVLYENNSRIEVGSNEVKAVFVNSNPNYEEIPSLIAVLTVYEPISLQEFTSLDGTVKIILNGENTTHYEFAMDELKEEVLEVFRDKYIVIKTYDLYLKNGEGIVRQGDFNVEILLYQNVNDCKFVEILSNGEFKEIEYDVDVNKLIFKTSYLGQYAIIKNIPKNGVNLAAILIPIISVLVVGIGVCLGVIIYKKKLSKNMTKKTENDEKTPANKDEKMVSKSKKMNASSERKKYTKNKKN